MFCRSLPFVINPYVLRILHEGLEWFSAIFIEFPEELYELKSAGVNECAEHVDGHTECMSEDADDNQGNGALDTGSGHRAKQVDYAGDNACCQA